MHVGGGGQRTTLGRSIGGALATLIRRARLITLIARYLTVASARGAGSERTSEESRPAGLQLGDIGRTAVITEHRCHAHEQDRGQLVAHTLWLAVVRERAQPGQEPRLGVDHALVQVEHVYLAPGRRAEHRVLERRGGSSPDAISCRAPAARLPSAGLYNAVARCTF